MSKGAVTRLYWSLVDMTTQLNYGKLILEYASERHSTLILYPLHEPLMLQNVTRLGFMSLRAQWMGRFVMSRFVQSKDVVCSPNKTCFKICHQKIELLASEEC